jgi:excisionase family DNA binding protein
MTSPSESAGTVAPHETLWTVKDVAAYLKLSESWVNKRAADGTLPTLRIGRALRFEPDAIRAWMRGEECGGAVVTLTGRR